MSLIGAVRPDSWNFPLLVHVLVVVEGEKSRIGTVDRDASAHLGMAVLEVKLSRMWREQNELRRETGDVLSQVVIAREQHHTGRQVF